MSIAVAQNPFIPAFSHGLEACLQSASRVRFGAGENAMILGTQVRFPTAGEVQEARQALAQFDHALRPPTQHALSKAVQDFAEMVNAGAANPMPGSALKMRATALAIACAELPAMAWDNGLTREAMGRFKFFPSVAEVVALINERTAPMRETAAALKVMLHKAQQRTEEQKREEISAEEKEAVAAKMAAWRATNPDPEPERRRPEVKMPSVAERIAECRRQIEADPASAVWLMPMIERLQAQTMPKNGHSTRHSHPKPIGAYMAAGNHQRAM